MKIETINIEREGNLLEVITNENVYVIRKSYFHDGKLEMRPVKECSIEEITNKDNLIIRISK